MSKIKILNATAVGALIEKSFKAADDAGQVVHEAAIQCLLHAKEHGDVTLMERLVTGLEERSMNMRGLRFWAGNFSPLMARAGKWSMLATDGDAYTKYLERAVSAGYGEGELGVGDRVFFIDKANETPFWKLGEVKKDNGQNIARITTATLMGQVIGLEGRLDKGIEKGTFVGDKKLAEDFAEYMAEAARTFQKLHKDAFRAEAVMLAKDKAEDKGSGTDAPVAVEVGGLDTTTQDEAKVESPIPEVANA